MMRAMFGALVALLLTAGAAFAVVLPATPDTLAAQVKAAQPGDVLLLADGAYGPLSLGRAKGLTIRGGRGAVLASFNLSSVEDVAVEGVSVRFAPPSISANAGRVYDSKGVALRGLRIECLPVPEGAANARRASDVPPPGQNAFLVGFGAGRALEVGFSSGVTVTGSEITGCHTGIVLANGDHLSVIGNDLHDVRNTFIKGGSFSFAEIRDNRMGRATPYRYVDPATGKATGDHLDAIHFYTAKDKGPMTDVVIAGNYIDYTGSDAQPLGINIEDNGYGGFQRLLIEGNTVILGNTQGINVAAAAEGIIRSNDLIAPAGADKYPTVVLRGDLIALTGNRLHDTSVKPYLSARYPDNLFRKRAKTTEAEVAAVRAAGLARFAPAPAKTLTLEEQVADLRSRVAALEAAR